jgi:hypothetical protein
VVSASDRPAPGVPTPATSSATPADLARAAAVEGWLPSGFSLSAVSGLTVSGGGVSAHGAQAVYRLPGYPDTSPWGRIVVVWQPVTGTSAPPPAAVRVVSANDGSTTAFGSTAAQRVVVTEWPAKAGAAPALSDAAITTLTRRLLADS